MNAHDPLHISSPVRLASSSNRTEREARLERFRETFDAQYTALLGAWQQCDQFQLEHAQRQFINTMKAARDEIDGKKPKTVPFNTFRAIQEIIASATRDEERGEIYDNEAWPK